jgi:lysophospholipase L1-like esterase
MRVFAWISGAVLALVLALIVIVYIQGRPSHDKPQYVAMGSSFAAGPAITEHAENSLWLCARSRDNYAHQLARLRGLSLVDVTCSGATTKNILDHGQFMQPAQIEAVTAETELVTITIGGNDIAYLGNMMAMGCDEKTSWTSWYAKKIGACRIRSAAEMEQGLPQVLNNLIAIITEVHQRAPKAKVVLLNYQSVLPENGSCARLGLTEAQASEMRGIADRLAEVTSAAAKGHGALLMDARRITQGHDVCAKDSWMHAMHPPQGLLGAPLHPTLEGMTALAQGLNDLLGQP